MGKTKILCVADGGITVKMMEELSALEKFGAEITIVEDKDMYAMGPITDRMTLIEHEGIDAAPTCQALLDNCADKDILVVHVASINKEVIEKAKNLKVAAVLRGGYENADVPRLTEKGVKLINAPWRSANAVADFAVGMMIAENKNIARSHHLIMEGKWCKKYDNQSYIHDMRKMTVGIIGYGYIGQRVRMRLQGFESKVIVHDPYADPKKFADQNVEFVSLDELLEQSLPTGQFRVTSQAVATAPDQAPAPRPRASQQLVLEVGGVRHPLVPPGLVIGRGSNADLRVNDPGGSRRHAMISVSGPLENRTIRIEDLGSTNGIVVDGSRVQAAQLRDGSRIEIGNTRMLVHSPSEA